MRFTVKIHHTHKKQSENPTKNIVIETKVKNDYKNFWN